METCRNVGGNLHYCIGYSCNRGGSVWGTNPYTSDSDYCRCARHSNSVGMNGGYFVVESRPGQNSYSGSTNQRINTSSYGSYPTSIYIRAANEKEIQSANPVKYQNIQVIFNTTVVSGDNCDKLMQVWENQSTDSYLIGLKQCFSEELCKFRKGLYERYLDKTKKAITQAVNSEKIKITQQTELIKNQEITLKNVNTPQEVIVKSIEPLKKYLGNLQKSVRSLEKLIMELKSF